MARSTCEKPGQEAADRRDPPSELAGTRRSPGCQDGLRLTSWCCGQTGGPGREETVAVRAACVEGRPLQSWAAKPTTTYPSVMVCGKTHISGQPREHEPHSALQRFAAFLPEAHGAAGSY